MRFKDRFRKSIYGFFRDEINEFVGANKTPEVVEVQRVFPDTKILRTEVIIPEYEYRSRFGSFKNENDENFREMHDAIYRVKEDLVKKVIDSGLVHIDSVELLSAVRNGGKKIVATIGIAKLGF